MKHLASISCAFLMTACATKPANVAPMAGGTFRTTDFGESQNEA
jgi:hypothetical protein